MRLRSLRRWPAVSYLQPALPTPPAPPARRAAKIFFSAATVAAMLVALLPLGSAMAAPPTTGQVGYWRANEGSGTTLVDSSGGSRNGSLIGSPTWVAGQDGLALSLSGTGQYATVPDSAALDISGAITMATWVKPGRIGTQYLIKKAIQPPTGTNGYELSLASTGLPFVRFNQSTGPDLYRVNATTIAAVGVWMHVAATYDGTTMSLYIDGVLEGSKAGPTAIATNALNLGIGAQPNGATPLQGALDEVLLYNTALTPAQIAALATVAPPSSPPDAPVVSAPTDGATGQGISPTLDVVVTDPDNDAMTVTFYGRPKASGVFEVIDTVAGVASGAHATATWPSLGHGQGYEWYATADDGASTVTTGPTWTFSTAAGSDPVFVGAGDIASCTASGDAATAPIVAAIEGTVFTTGDDAYPNGTATDFTSCYDPTWGAVKSRTRPTPGNHDWNTANLAGYRGYFGPSATDANGQSYYSYDIGSNWHIVNLDSECAKVPGGCGVGSPQETWLRADLAANSTKNVIGLWHKPRFSSGATNLTDVQPFVDALYEAGADITLVGHDHVYERQAPLDAAGQADPSFGIRTFTVGTGGESHHSLGTVRSTSQSLNNDTFGVLKLTLHANTYDWEFFPEAGKTFTDSGTASVHGAPDPGPGASFSSIPVSASTGEKPQSKLWQHAGTWWAVMPTTTASVSPAGTWVWRLNPDDTWSPVTRISSSTTAKADALADGDVTHILLHSSSPELVSIEYDSVNDTYEPWSQRATPTAVSLSGSETATIAIDSADRMWLATENGANLNVHYSDAPYTAFSGPVTLANNIDGDDIGVVTALTNNRIGVLWSNQTTRRFGFKVHIDGQDPGTWSVDEVPASQSALNVGLGMADDHLNVVVGSDGTLYAAVKTSYDTVGYPKVALLVRRPNGTWDPLYEVDQAGTRGIVLLNEQDQTVRVVYTSSEGFNDIVVKESFTSSISFGPRSDVITGGVNDATSTKQRWTGRVPVMASTATTAETGFLTEGSPPPAVGIVGNWKMDEGTGSTILDDSGLGNDGALSGNPTWVAGKHDLALRLDGTGDYASVPDDASLDITGEITMAAWVRPEKLGTQYLIKKAINTTTNGYELSLSTNGGGTVFVRFNEATSGATFRIDSTSLYPTDGATWMHVAATSDGTTMSLYIDGVLEGSKAGPTSIATNALNLGIGAQGNGVSPLQGSLDDVLLSNVAMSASEIAALADDGTVNSPPVLDPVGNKTVDEETELAFTATATDADVGDTLVFALANGTPTGASITPGGDFTWTPTETQDGVHTFDVCVSDGTDTVCETITVTVNEVTVNSPPVLDPVGNKTVDEETELAFTATATDADVGDTLSFSLANGTPTGASITPGGDFTWTPTETQDGVHTFDVCVSDGTDTVCETITVTVNEVTVNSPPVLDPVGNKTVDEETELAFTATATDADVGDTLSFSLANGTPTGASITPGGDFTWTPTETQDGVHTFDVCVSDGTDTVCETITVTVNEVTVGGTTLFADDFESGTLAAWVNTGLAVQQVHVANGIWAARSTTTGQVSSASHAFAQSQSEVVFDAKVKVVSQGSTSQVNLMRLNGAGGGARLRLYLTPSGTLALKKSSGAIITSSTTVTPGVFHDLQLRLLVGAAGRSEAWLDGVKISQLSVTQNFGTGLIGGVGIGESQTGRTSDVAYDDVVVSTPEPPVVTPFLFTDDFESGTLDAWVNSGLSVQQLHVANGTWAARSTTTGQLAFASRTLAQSQSEVFFQAQVKLISKGASSQVNLMRLNAASGGVRLRLYLTPSGALALKKSSGSTITSTTTLTSGAWHELQLRLLVGQPGQSEVWLDGVRIAALSVSQNFGNGKVAGVSIGESQTGRTADVVYDDVVVDSEPVV